MGFFNWFKGTQKDSRDILAKGEEWAVPEEWFEDVDGKKVRRKKKRGCCGCACEIVPPPEGELVSLPLEEAVAAMVAGSQVGENEEPKDICCFDWDAVKACQDKTANEEMIEDLTQLAETLEKENQVTVPQNYSAVEPTYSPEVYTSPEPTYSPPAYDPPSTSSYDSGSSGSSYDSGGSSSYDSGGSSSFSSD